MVRAEKVNGGLWTSVFILGVSYHSILQKMTVAAFPWEAVLSWLPVPTCKRIWGFHSLRLRHLASVPVCACRSSRQERKFSPTTAACLLFLAGALTCFFRYTPNFCQFDNPPVILTMWVTACSILALLLRPRSEGLTVLALWAGRAAFWRSRTLSSVTDVSRKFTAPWLQVESFTRVILLGITHLFSHQWDLSWPCKVLKTPKQHSF